ncbi:MAG: hypothetical protein M3414_00110, partial [Pseudomonadota bacterium]|nr:hypothetical protein [Pseudomonadota bacterium]
SIGATSSLTQGAAFKGLGEHFNIEIESQGGQTAEGMRHRVRLVWGMGSYDAEGTLFHRGTPGPRGAPIMLDGTLDTAQGRKAIQIGIATEACTDDADRAHPQRVLVIVQGEGEMRGCGNLAMY